MQFPCPVNPIHLLQLVPVFSLIYLARSPRAPFSSTDQRSEKESSSRFLKPFVFLSKCPLWRGKEGRAVRWRFVVSFISVPGIYADLELNRVSNNGNYCNLLAIRELHPEMGDLTWQLHLQF